MKTYISDIIPKIQRYSHKLDNLTMLTNQHWVVIDEIENSKNVYIFRQNNELLISQNGKVDKAKWEYLGHNSLLIDRKDESYLFKHGFFDENILALKIDSKDEYAFLVNETNFDKELNSIERVVEFLSSKYIEPVIKGKLQDSLDIEISTDEMLNQLEINWEVKQENQNIKKTFWGNTITEFKIVFMDNSSGSIYKDGNGFYLIDETGANKMYYIDKRQTVNSLFHLLKYKKTNMEGYIKWKPK